jgi:hypothetical protein
VGSACTAFTDLQEGFTLAVDTLFGWKEKLRPNPAVRQNVKCSEF